MSCDSWHRAQAFSSGSLESEWSWEDSCEENATRYTDLYFFLVNTAPSPHPKEQKSKRYSVHLWDVMKLALKIDFSTVLEWINLFSTTAWADIPASVIKFPTIKLLTVTFVCSKGRDCAPRAEPNSDVNSVGWQKAHFHILRPSLLSVN